jgi:hypothetical protein
MELVRDTPHWSGTRRIASDGLDRGPRSSSSRILDFTLSILAFTLSMVFENLVLWEVAAKGAPNPGPRQMPC